MHFQCDLEFNKPTGFYRIFDLQCFHYLRCVCFLSGWYIFLFYLLLFVCSHFRTFVTFYGIFVFLHYFLLAMFSSSLRSSQPVLSLVFWFFFGFAIFFVAFSFYKTKNSITSSFPTISIHHSLLFMSAPFCWLINITFIGMPPYILCTTYNDILISMFNSFEWHDTWG